MDEPTQRSEPTSDGAGRSYWRWSKHDLFPGDSFHSLQSYRRALSETCPRLVDRLTNRSTDDYELLQLPKESENDMRKCLTWWDLMWLSFGAVVGSGIFIITGQEAHDHAGPAIVLSYAASGLSALLSAFCYTEFAVEIPVAGGAAGLGRSWTSYFSTMIKDDPDFLRIRVGSFKEGFNMLDPLAVVVLLLANGIAVSGTRRTSILNWISSVATTFIIGFIIVVAFIHAKISNLVPFAPDGAKGVFEAAAVVFWSYTGFDMVATMAEETKKPSRDIPVGLIGSMTMITVIYCVMALALTMMQKYTEIDRDAAYSVAFVSIGMNWAKYLVSISALKGMTTSLLAGSLGQARYTTQIARSHMIPPLFARVHPRTGTPVNATLLITIGSAIIAFFSSLDVLSSVFSFSTLFIFMLMVVALLVRRYYIRDRTSRNDLIKLVVLLCVVIGSSAVGTALWSSDKLGWVGYSVAAIVWFVATLVMASVPKKRTPKVWGVPLVPWLPSLSIAMNVFLLGSLGSVAFWRFLICSAVMLLYYLFIGVHTTYDLAHENEPGSKYEQGNDEKNGEVL
ncbi:cationic amino acid transporter 8, vacuolar isoform X2 [Prosopis cineraria]|uniref:cationic amino acid transporter 8, vacuolar isoform X2 n=1 Tax=Prosopis cineraria TaxID=364024 RepID=UPI0024104F00|nr:cationic amino acid transporter 8, vacuolar isoform X2 [Prosopis cineraria]